MAKILSPLCNITQGCYAITCIWKDRNIKAATKVKVMKSMVWAVFQYGVEWWTLKTSDRNKIEAFQMWCWRKILSISWQEHRTNDSILTEFGLERELIGRVAKLKLRYFGHITRRSAGQTAGVVNCCKRIATLETCCSQSSSVVLITPKSNRKRFSQCHIRVCVRFLETTTSSNVTIRKK